MDNLNQINRMTETEFENYVEAASQAELEYLLENIQSLNIKISTLLVKIKPTPNVDKMILELANSKEYFTNIIQSYDISNIITPMLQHAVKLGYTINDTIEKYVTKFSVEDFEIALKLSKHSLLFEKCPIFNILYPYLNKTTIVFAAANPNITEDAIKKFVSKYDDDIFNTLFDNPAVDESTNTYIANELSKHGKLGVKYGSEFTGNMSVNTMHQVLDNLREHTYPRANRIDNLLIKPENAQFLLDYNIWKNMISNKSRVAVVKHFINDEEIYDIISNVFAKNPKEFLVAILACLTDSPRMINTIRPLFMEIVRDDIHNQYVSTKTSTLINTLIIHPEIANDDFVRDLVVYIFNKKAYPKFLDYFAPTQANIPQSLWVRFCNAIVEYIISEKSAYEWWYTYLNKRGKYLPRLEEDKILALLDKSEVAHIIIDNFIKFQKITPNIIRKIGQYKWMTYDALLKISIPSFLLPELVETYPHLLFHPNFPANKIDEYFDNNIFVLNTLNKNKLDQELSSSPALSHKLVQHILSNYKDDLVFNSSKLTKLSLLRDIMDNYRYPCSAKTLELVHKELGYREDLEGVYISNRNTPLSILKAYYPQSRFKRDIILHPNADPNWYTTIELNESWDIYKLFQNKRLSKNQLISLVEKLHTLKDPTHESVLSDAIPILEQHPNYDADIQKLISKLWGYGSFTTPTKRQTPIEIDQSDLYLLALMLKSKPSMSFGELNKLNPNLSKSKDVVAFKQFMSGKPFTLQDILEFDEKSALPTTDVTQWMHFFKHNTKVYRSLWVHKAQIAFTQRKNYVLQFNIRKNVFPQFIKMIGINTKRAITILKELQGSPHPYHHSDITLGWVRYTILPNNTIWIDEVQTDWTKYVIHEIENKLLATLAYFMTKEFIKLAHKYYGATKLIMPSIFIKKVVYKAEPPRSIYKELPKRLRFVPSTIEKEQIKLRKVPMSTPIWVLEAGVK